MYYKMQSVATKNPSNLSKVFVAVVSFGTTSTIKFVKFWIN